MSQLLSIIGLTSSELAAWVQAIGSVIAIVAVAWLAIWQSRKQYENALRLHKEEQIYTRVEVANTLSVLSRNCAKAVRYITDQLQDREAVYKAAEGYVYLDFGEIRNIERVVTGIPLHNLPADLVSHAMILSATIRQFREKIEIALRLHSNMKADDFADLFRSFKEMNTSLEATCDDIDKEILRITDETREQGESKMFVTNNDKANGEKGYQLRWFQKTKTTDWILSFCTLAIAIIGFYQYQALEKTDQTSRLRDRAFVYFPNPTFLPYPSDKPVVWGTNIHVKNEGNMPARSISIRQAIVTPKKSQNVIDPFPLAKWSERQVQNVIGPKQLLILQGIDIPISTIEEAQKPNSDIDIFILMEAKYIDGFDLDKSRITQTSRILRFDNYGGISLGYGGPHNCTDDDCPGL